MASFSIPLTGLEADSTALNTIANDLSNINTTAFKSQNTTFGDLFYQEIGSTGSGDEIQKGSGVKVATNTTDFTQGSISSTGVSSDVAIDGSGFFVLDNNGSQLLTRNGDFQLSSDGTLETSDGLAVMGYSATNGVVNTGGPLTDIVIPTNTAMSPSATSTFNMTQNLDANAAVGTSTTGTLEVYDSLGNSYEATVTYTKTGTNTWSYNITVPESLSATNNTTATATALAVTTGTPANANVTVPLTANSAATAMNGVTLTPATAVNGGNTTYTYNFGAGGSVDATTSLSIAGNALVIPGGGESIAALQGQISALGLAGVSASVNGNTLSITAPTATAMSGSVVGDLSGATDTYTFNTGGTVDPASTLTISGTTTAGAAATITAPAISSGESITQYAADLNTAIANAGIANVTVTANTATNTLSISGPDLATAGSLSEDLTGTSTAYDFGSTATVDPSTNLSITGQTTTGASATITPPTVTAGETVAQYQAALNTALQAAGIVGVSVTSTGGQLTITGANMSTTGSMIQDENTTSTSYTFGSSGGTLAAVDPTTNLTISGLTSTGTTATMVAPTITAGETVATYAAALQQAMNTAGIAGVTVTDNNGVLTITGANQTATGNVVQDPVASANATGTLTFDASGNLATPGADISGITFSGLSDGASALNMTWDLYGSNGAGNISQTVADSATSSTSQNGYASGTFESYTIGSDGTISVAYSNGQNQDVGQIAVATVTNEQGLTNLGSTEYQATSASGPATVGVAGTGGRGALEGSSLEASNVNISTEFSDLIVAQRAFEANAKSVTTFDTVTQDTINMVH